LNCQTKFSRAVDINGQECLDKDFEIGGGVSASESTAAAMERNVTMTVLVVDDDESARNLCMDVVSESKMRAKGAATAEQALTILDQYPIDIVITELRVPRMGGLELLKRVKAEHPQTDVIILTQYGSYDDVVSVTKAGAADYVSKPFRIDDLRGKLGCLAHSIEIDRENCLLKGQLQTPLGFGALIGLSPRMASVYRMIEKVSHQDCSVLILGESGTGKELVAGAIHHAGPRRNKPFVPVDCSTIAPSLIESELFGHVRGSFTGAVQTKAGLLETAECGTLFLDEIGNLPIDLQAKLLRTLQNHEIRAVGSNKLVKLNARIIAATNLDLEMAVRTGTFRQDLFYRLNIVQIKVPPLRERKNDILLLANEFLKRFSQQNGQSWSLSAEAMSALIAYDWPGNVRELENAIERGVTLGSASIVHFADLPSSVQDRYPTLTPVEDVVDWAEVEKRTIYKALRESGGDKIAAARAMGIGKTTVYRKLKQYEEQKEQKGKLQVVKSEPHLGRTNAATRAPRNQISG
jgi:DNA-binding NtrC family response regulator